MRKYAWAGLAILFTFLSLSTNWGGQAAGEPPLPLDRYWQLVEETHRLVIDLQDAPEGEVRTELAPFSKRWAAVRTVTFPNGTTIPISSDSLVAQLQAAHPDLDRLAGLLSALLTARAAWPENLFSPDELRPLASILAQPEFQWQPDQRSPLEEWWDNLKKRALEFFVQLLRDAISSSGSSLIRPALLGLGIITVVLALLYIFRNIRAALVQEAELEVEAAHGDEDLNADAALQRAQEQAGSGDYRSAVRYLYLSALLHMEERGLLRYDRSKTNREYLRSVAQQPNLENRLRDVVEIFDRVWYGYQPLDEAAYARYAAQVDELRRQK